MIEITDFIIDISRDVMEMRHDPALAMALAGSYAVDTDLPDGETILIHGPVNWTAHGQWKGALPDINAGPTEFLFTDYGLRGVGQITGVSPIVGDIVNVDITGMGKIERVR